MAGDEAERTEPATPHKRDEARKRGEVAQSREVSGVVLLSVFLIAVSTFLGPRLMMALATQCKAGWGGLARGPQSLGDFHAVLLAHGKVAASGVLPLLMLLVAAALLAPLLQSGPLFSMEALQPRPEKLDPFKGMKRLVSPEKLVDLAKAILKVVMVGGLAWVILQNALPTLVTLLDLSIGDALAVTGLITRRMAISVLSALAVLALGDLLWQRYQYEKKLRMSRNEVRDEVKQHEGDPRLRSRFRARQLDLSRARMIADVADADVVVTNPTHYAVALVYERAQMRAPKVLAKGRGHVAQRIREAAEAAGVPLVENPVLARALHRSAEVGRHVPEALFQAVAEVLAAVYRLDPRRASRWSDVS